MCLPHRKEIHFFDLQFWRRNEWYLKHFASPDSTANARHALTGEATPYYLFHPDVPSRCYSLLPNVRLIVLVRNPVDRAYSHYLHSVKTGHESLTFEAALDAEPTRMREATPFLEAGLNRASQGHRLYSYLNRGLYADQLERWIQLFPLEQILLICSEDLFQDPAIQCSKILSFLGVPKMLLAFPSRSGEPYAPMPDPIRGRLVQFFKPHNARLYHYLEKLAGAKQRFPEIASLWDR
jgi:hypothetical protein